MHENNSSSRFSRRRAIQTLFCSSAALALNIRPDGADAAVEKDALHLLMIGDFGTGGRDQRKVAEAMQKFVGDKGIRPSGLLLLGDNFYNEDKAGFSTESPRWKTEIEDMYPASVFPGPMWSVLGNHDYHDNRGGEKVQLAYARKPGVRWQFPAKWYRFDLGLNGASAASPSSPKQYRVEKGDNLYRVGKKFGVAYEEIMAINRLQNSVIHANQILLIPGAREQALATFICLDSNLPAVSGSRDKKNKTTRGSLTAEEEKEQLAWLKSELAKPRAPFTIAVAHHPLYSNGSHGDTKTLVNQWEPLFQEHQVHAYLCGHDHDLQHLEMEGRFTTHLLSGGGGASLRKLKVSHKVPYGKDVHGFTHLQITPGALTFTHYSAEGAALHSVTKKQDGRFEVAAV